jgi:N-acetylneuraminate synthase
MNQTGKTYIIAEAGVNHNGSLEMAKSLIDVAVECGVDAIKFQTFCAEKLVSKAAGKADYQKRTTEAGESQLDMIKKLELDEKAHHELIQYCHMQDIQFLSTPFDLDSLRLLISCFDLPYIKISSGEITNPPFLLEIARTGKSVILSTGMSTLGEIEIALGVLAFGYLGKGEYPCIETFQEAYSSIDGRQLLQQKVSLLHCTTEYPAPFGEVNLKAMDTLRSAFGLPVGFSDHTSGIAVPLAAVARGAVIIEKHFTLDRNLPGPDHKASLEPVELKNMVESIRQIEEALGYSYKIPTPSEVKNKTVARKSLVANQAIKRGEKFTIDNLTTKRPGTGLSPLYYWEWLGKFAERDYEQDERVGI